MRTFHALPACPRGRRKPLAATLRPLPGPSEEPAFVGPLPVDGRAGGVTRRDGGRGRKVWRARSRAMPPLSSIPRFASDNRRGRRSGAGPQQAGG